MLEIQKLMNVLRFRWEDDWTRIVIMQTAASKEQFASSDTSHTSFSNDKYTGMLFW